MKKLLGMLLVFMLVFACGQSQLNMDIQITGNPPAIEAPLEIQQTVLQGQSVAYEGFVNNGAPIYVQEAPALFSSSNGKELKRALCMIIPDNIVSQKVGLKSSKAKPDFKFIEGPNGTLDLTENGQPVLSYNFGMQLPEGVEPDQKRSSYVYPIYDLNGTNVFDDFPADHYHHRGLSWMWPGVFIRGTKYDLWHIEGIRQLFGEWLGQEVGPVCATFGVKNGWHLKDRQVVAEYIWLRVFKASDFGRVIDISLTFILLYNSSNNNIYSRAANLVKLSNRERRYSSQPYN